jgi:hypothetical protein
MRSFWLTTILFAIIGCSDMPDGPTPVNIETPEGNVTAHKTTVDAVPQKVTAATGDELEQLKSFDATGSDFLAAYLPGTSDPALKVYDRAFRAWQTSDSPQHSNEQVVQILGGYLGNKCVADLDMEWVTVTDEYGTDYAVRGKTVDVMAFPFSTVLKRIENNEYDFMYGVYPSAGTDDAWVSCGLSRGRATGEDDGLLGPRVASPFVLRPTAWTRASCATPHW